MLMEAKVIQGGSRCQEKNEEGMREDSSLRNAQEMKPAGTRKGDQGSQDPGNGWPKGGGGLKSLLPGKENDTGGQEVEIFPRDPGK